MDGSSPGDRRPLTNAELFAVAHDLMTSHDPLEVLDEIKCAAHALAARHDKEGLVSLRRLVQAIAVLCEDRTEGSPLN